MLIYGHAGDLWGVCFHPKKPNICATVCDSNRIFIWDNDVRDMVRTAYIGFAGRTGAFSSAPVGGGGHHLAIGGAKGHLKVSQQRSGNISDENL